MLNKELEVAFKDLSTPLISDACLRLSVPLRIAPAGIRPVWPGMRHVWDMPEHGQSVKLDKTFVFSTATECFY